MKNRNLLWTACILSVASLTATGQITINAGDFEIAGTFTMGQSNNDATFNVGSAGANQTWDFTNNAWFVIQHCEYVNPADTPHGSSFPGATRTRHIWVNSPTNDVYTYDQIAANGFYNLGSVIADTLFYINDQPALYWPLPLTFPQQWTAIRRYHYASPGGTVTNVDSTISVTDGWGTLNTPYGSYSVLRLFNRVWHTTHTGTLPPTTSQQVGYVWINQQGSIILQVTSPSGITDPNFSTGQLLMKDAALDADPPRNSIAATMVLRQNYPNPFNPSTEITYALPRTQNVSLKVFDLLGREVTTLASGMQTAGEHRIRFDGQNLPSGMYLYRLETDENTQTRKMILLK